MHAGQETQMMRGAVWACVIPVGLGVIAAILAGWAITSFSDLNDESLGGRDVINSILIIGTIIGCFMLSAPLSAWLACRRLAKISSLSKLSAWRCSAKYGVLNASLVHFVMVIMYSTGVIMFIFRVDGSSFGPEVFGIYLLALMYNVVIWIIVTLPLSLLCATIFHRVTKFPEDRTVF